MNKVMFGLASCVLLLLNTVKADTPESPIPSGLGSYENCVPGTTWMDDCNTCHCNENGLAACTRMLCFPEEIQKCTPGTSWTEDCRSCVCSDQGVSSCTGDSCSTTPMPTNA
ncbi:hypothetical protein J6590_055139 [Homalodisca vitripennis]|nr:hypothetical protein J6590_055139 [Homalodisca vitripennis]